MTERMQRILPTVQKPARYTGGEWGEIKKDLKDVRVRVAFCFPDTYEIGMSNLGMRILYGVMNGMDGVWCERVFAPWGDMEQAMRDNALPLWALESQTPVREFDMIAFTIGYEMAYSNILNMLNLAGVPLRSKDRPGLKNIVFAGGVCAFNPEPLADFIDFFPWARARTSPWRFCNSMTGRRPRDGARTHFSMKWRKSPACTSPASTATNTTPTAPSPPSCRWRAHPRGWPSASSKT